MGACFSKTQAKQDKTLGQAPQPMVPPKDSPGAPDVNQEALSQSIKVVPSSGGTKEQPGPSGNLDISGISEKLPQKSILQPAKQEQTMIKPQSLDSKRLLDMCSKTAEQVEQAEAHLEALKALIKKMGLLDLAQVRGLKKILNFVLNPEQNQGLAKKRYETSQWNPLLHAVASKNLDAVKTLFECVPLFHKLNCLSKPYSLEAQKEKVFDHSKRLKRECFALKLAILNRDDETLKYLWNEHRVLWNLGHFFVCLKAITRGAWEKGLKILLASSTSKVLFLSVNTSPEDFISIVKVFKRELEGYDAINAEFAKVIRTGFLSRQYFSLSFFVELIDHSKSPDEKHLQRCLQGIQEEDLQFSHADFDRVFELIKGQVPESNMRHGVLIEQQKHAFLGKFPNRDKHIAQQLDQLKFLLENVDVGQAEELVKVCEELLDIIDDLDLLALGPLSLNGKDTNVLLESLRLGLDPVVDYFMSEDYFNIRAALKRNNAFELDNEISHFNVSYLLGHVQRNPRFLKKMYFALVDIFQLSTFLEIFNHIAKDSPQGVQVTAFMLDEQRFKSLFSGSLEFQKYIFVKTMADTTSHFNQIQPILKKEPYIKYLEQIERGYCGEDFSSKTIAHLKQLAAEKMRRKAIKVEEELLKESPLLEESKIQSPHSQERQQFIETGKFRMDSKVHEGSSLGQPDASDKKHAPLILEMDRRQEHSLIFSPTNGNGTENIFSPSVDMSGIGIQYTQAHNAQPLKTLEVLDNQLSQETVPMVTAFRTQVDAQQLKERLSIIESEGGVNFDEDDDRSLGKDVEDDDAMNLSRRVPQPTSQIKHQFLKEESVYLGVQPSNHVKFIGFESAFKEIVLAIQSGNLVHVKALLKKFNIKNVASLRNLEQEGVARADDAQVPRHLEVKGSSKEYDTAMWNPVLFAIYFQKTDILRCLLQEYVAVPIMAIRQPPPNEFTEYITPFSKRQDQYAQTHRPNMSQGVVRLSPTKRDESPTPLRNNFTVEQRSVVINTEIENLKESAIMDRMGDDTFDLVLNNNTRRNGPKVETFYPSDSHIECFGIELAIRNKDLQAFKCLWNELSVIWEDRHFACVLDRVIQERWDQGLATVFRSKTSHTIYRSMPPQDRDNFLFSKIVDKITELEFWENDAISPLRVTAQQVDIIVAELSYDPYGSYAVLRFPDLFLSRGLLENALKKVQFEDIQDFVIARHENVQHLSDFIKRYSEEGGPQIVGGPLSDEVRRQISQHEKLLVSLQSVLKKAQGLLQQHQQSPLSYKTEDLKPDKLIALIKLGDLAGFKRYLELGEGVILLEKLSLMTGFEDPDYMKYFLANVKYEPTDSLMRHLIYDGSEQLTFYWNPLIFAIYYQKLDIVEYLCKSPLVYLRKCLTKPFELVPNQMLSENDDIDDDESFVTEKSELFPLILSVMMNNRDIFRYLLKRCGFLLNDIHLNLLTNYVLEALSSKGEWVDGLRVLLTSPTTHQIFNAMNLYEKDRYLKFCNKSISDLHYSMVNSGQSTKSNILSDFRYLMAFEPYNAFYLSILASTDELQFWDSTGESDESVSKELFIKTCLLNFDERAFVTLHKYNSHYINEFISIAQGHGAPRGLSVRQSQDPARPSSLALFAAKLKKYAATLTLHHAALRLSETLRHSVLSNLGQ